MSYQLRKILFLMPWVFASLTRQKIYNRNLIVFWICLSINKVLTLLEISVFELPNDRICWIKVILVKDDLSQDLPDVELITHLVVGQQDARQLPNQLVVKNLDLGIPNYSLSFKRLELKYSVDLNNEHQNEGNIWIVSF